MLVADLLKTITPQYLPLYFISLFGSFFFLRSIIRALFSPLRSIPGPPLARFTRLWYLCKTWRADFEKTNIELHRKYGPIVRITPYEYSIDDPAAVRPIYGHGTQFTKAFWYDASDNPEIHAQNTFAGRDPKLHAANRRKVAGFYSVTSLLKNMESRADECSKVLKERFREISRSGSEVDLQWWMECYAFDVIGSMSLGKRFGFLDTGKDPLQLCSGLESAFSYASVVGIYAEFHHILFKIAKHIGLSTARPLEFTLKQIQRRLQGSREPGEKAEGDFLETVLRTHNEDPESFSMQDVVNALWINIIAGSDTTSISLTGIMWNVLKHPEVLKKLRAEIDEKTAAGELSDPVKYSQAQNMPYLQAIIQEGLRMHPATGWPLWRTVPKGGIELVGKYFSEGTVVGVNAWVAHANKDVFGDDADQFRPERWLESKEKTQQMERYFLAFGHGSRTCLGKNISLMEISKLVPMLIRDFDFQLKPATKVESLNRCFVKQKNVLVTIEEKKA